jgi:hypothetical protein
MSLLLSLAPGFSRVLEAAARASRFNGLPGVTTISRVDCLVKTVGNGFRQQPRRFTRLKPGANEIASLIVVPGQRKGQIDYRS